MSTSGGKYDRNVGRLIEDYPDYGIGAGFEAVGYSARRKVNGRPCGKPIPAMDLDELAEKMDADRAELSRDGGRDVRAAMANARRAVDEYRAFAPDAATTAEEWRQQATRGNFALLRLVQAIDGAPAPEDAQDAAELAPQ